MATRKAPLAVGTTPMGELVDGGDREPEPTDAHGVDPMGKRALFSQIGFEPPALGYVGIECSTCGESSVVGISRAVRLLIGSVSLPLLRSEYPTLLRCPSCDRRTWVRLSIRL